MSGDGERSINSVLYSHLSFNDVLVKSLDNYLDSLKANMSMARSEYLCNLRYFNCFLKRFFSDCVKSASKDYYSVSLGRLYEDTIDSFVETVNNISSDLTESMNSFMADSACLISEFKFYQGGITDKRIISDDFNVLYDLLKMPVTNLLDHYMTVDKANLKSKGVLLNVSKDFEGDRFLTVDGITYLVDEEKRIINAYLLVKSEAVKLLNKSCVSSVNKMLELLINCASLIGNYQRFNESIIKFVGCD